MITAILRVCFTTTQFSSIWTPDRHGAHYNPSIVSNNVFVCLYVLTTTEKNYFQAHKLWRNKCWICTDVTALACILFCFAFFKISLTLFYLSLSLSLSLSSKILKVITEVCLFTNFLCYSFFVFVLKIQIFLQKKKETNFSLCQVFFSIYLLSLCHPLCLSTWGHSFLFGLYYLPTINKGLFILFLKYWLRERDNAIVTGKSIANFSRNSSIGTNR